MLKWVMFSTVSPAKHAFKEIKQIGTFACVAACLSYRLGVCVEEEPPPSVNVISFKPSKPREAVGDRDCFGFILGKVLN